jgi:hypothetical protein
VPRSERGGGGDIGIAEATTRYESWLAAQIPLIAPDLEQKHRAMSAGSLPFLRATYYRWAARWRAIVGDVAAAPRALAVGDLHVENFGTWRDAEGRLIWGVNDSSIASPGSGAWGGSASWRSPPGGADGSPARRRLWRPLHVPRRGAPSGNVHLGSCDARTLHADLRRRRKHWLYDAASRMADAVEEDWREWRRAAG